MIIAQSGLDQGAVGVIVGLLVVGIPLAVRGFRKLVKDVHELKVAVVGEPANAYHPATYGLTGDVRELKKAATTNLQGTATLIRDSKPDDGSSSRDVLDRIDEATKGQPDP